MTRRRYFGTIRQRPSGRWQVRYRGPDGLMRSAPETFARKSEAEQYLRLLEARIHRGEWTDPRLAKVTLAAYASEWIAQRPGLRPRTIELYDSLLKNYLTPGLGAVPIGKIDTPLIREWRAGLLAKGASQLQVAKAYRLLRAVLTTAADEDRLIPSNPCRIKGAGLEKSGERPVLTIDQVFALAEMVPERWRAFILLKTFASLRWGEITALTRADVSKAASTVTIRRQYVELRSRGMEHGPTKSRAGERTIALLPTVAEALRAHLATFTGPKPGDLVFAGLSGQPLRRSNFNKSVAWHEIVQQLGAPNLHLHDLRHTGNTFAVPRDRRQPQGPHDPDGP